MPTPEGLKGLREIVQRPGVRLGSSPCQSRSAGRLSLASFPNIKRPNSLCDQQDPRSSNHKEHGQEEEGHEESEPVEFGLREIIAAHKDDILATTLRRDDRKITAREQ